MNDLTDYLNNPGRGEGSAANELLSLVYDELRALASKRMAMEAPGQTLQGTALVHEAWLRLACGQKRQWNDRTHFFATAAEAMRRILVDTARRKRAERHGGKLERVEMPDIAMAAGDDQVLAIHEALEKFAAKDPQKADLVKLRYFVGMTIEEAADALGISVPTATRYWAYARAWLATEVRSQE